jgi:cytochrome P450
VTKIHSVAARNNTELLDALPPIAHHGQAVPYIYGGEERVLINDPVAIHKFMSVPLRRESPFTDINRRVMGQGLLVTNRMDLWKPRRRLIQRELSPTRVQIYEPSIIARTLTAMKAWTHAGEVSLRDEIGRLALDNLGEAVFGGDFGDFRETVHIALELLVEAGDNMEAGVRDPELEARLEEYVVKLEDVVRDLIGQRHNPLAVRAHVLDVLIQASNTDDPAFADPMVQDESITLMMAGHDTTAFLINMATFLLTKHPHVREKLAAEVAQARSSDVAPERLVQFLPYAKLVASETLRLYPPLPFIYRTAEEDVDVDGYLVKTGSTVTISPWILHRNPENFPDPLAFDPDRFGAERRDEIKRNTYLPFGLGQRVCAGNHFAMLETAIIISLIASDLDLEFASDTPAIDAPVTLRFTEPLTARVRAAS